MENPVILNHPLIQHKLSILRDKNTNSGLFRQLVKEIGMLMAYEVTRDLELGDCEIETPLEKTTSKILSGKKLAVVPILRAGLGMADGVLELIPQAKVGHVGLYRDHDTKKPIEYYSKLPQDTDKRDMILVDPMLATGESAAAAISVIKKHGAKSIKLVCIVGAPEGVELLKIQHPDVNIYLCSLDRQLDENCYILPGLGDAGDRIFGTK